MLDDTIPRIVQGNRVNTLQDHPVVVFHRKMIREKIRKIFPLDTWNNEEKYNPFLDEAWRVMCGTYKQLVYLPAMASSVGNNKGIYRG